MPSRNDGFLMDVRPGYKQTGIGVIPEDWKVVCLGELGTFKNGINKSGSEFGRGFPFVNLMDVFGVSSIDVSGKFGLVDTNAQEQESFNVKAGDVIFIRSSVKPSGVGLSAVVEEDLPKTVYSGFLIRFRDSGEIDIGFKRHCFHEEGFRKRVIAASSVSANTNINQENLKRLPICLPPTRAEQGAIADALSDIDAFNASLAQLLAKKRQIKEGVKQELLTGKRRLRGFSGNWEVKRLGQLGSFLKGRGITRDESGSGNLGCVRYGELYTRYENYIEDFHSWISREVAATATRLVHGDILFAGSGETKEDIGKCAAFVANVEAYAGGDIVILRNKKVDPLFLGYYLNTEVINGQKASKAQGDAIVHIGVHALADITCALPELAEERAIAVVLFDMDMELAALEAKLSKARLLKAGMMHELLTGRIRLT